MAEALAPSLYSQKRWMNSSSLLTCRIVLITNIITMR